MNSEIRKSGERKIVDLSRAIRLLKEFTKIDLDALDPQTSAQVVAALAAQGIDAYRSLSREGLPPNHLSPSARHVIEKYLEKNGSQASQAISSDLIDKLRTASRINDQDAEDLMEWFANQDDVAESRQISEQTISIINDIVQIRSEVFKEAFFKEGKWSREDVRARRAGHQPMPVLRLENESLDDDRQLAQYASQLWGHRIDEVRAFFDVAAAQSSVESIFGHGGSGVNDAMAFASANASAEARSEGWWNHLEHMGFVATDYRRLSLLWKYYSEKIVSQDDAESGREFPRRLFVPGANTIVVARSREGILLQRRPLDHMGGHNKGRLSLFGGGYKPPFLKNSHDDNKLHRTLIREVFEESGILIQTTNNPLILFLDELKIPSQMQICCVGSIESDQSDFSDSPPLDRLNNVKEGGVKFLSPQNIAHVLTENSWELSPHAFTALLVWIVAGTPNLSRSASQALCDALGLPRNSGIPFDRAQHLKNLLDRVRFVDQAHMARAHVLFTQISNK